MLGSIPALIIINILLICSKKIVVRCLSGSLINRCVEY